MILNEISQTMSQPETKKELGTSWHVIQVSLKKRALILGRKGWLDMKRTSKLDKRDQRKLVRLSVSNPKLPARQVMDGSSIASETSIHTARKENIAINQKKKKN